MESKTLTEQLRKVADLRQSLAIAKELKQKALAKWEEDNAGIINAVLLATESVTNAEASLRQAALEQYAKDQNKAPIPGVAIKIFTKLEYEQKKAFEWALEHKLALGLDKKAFEGAMKSIGFAPDFVTITEEPQAQIATDLSKFIEKKEK